MNKLNRETSGKFSSIPEAQVAVFRISKGWKGGFGEAVLDDENKIRRCEELPVYVDAKSNKEILDQVELPDCYIGQALIIVQGKVHLEKRKERNFTIPGAPEKNFYALVVDELLDVFSFAEPCE